MSFEADMSLAKLKLWIVSLFLLGTVMAGFATETSPAVAVLDFSVSATESNYWAWAEGGVADLVQIELQKQGLVLLDRDAIHAVLAEQRLADSGQTAENSLALAKLLNTQFLIAGKLVPLVGARFRIEATVFSVEAVETVVTAKGEGAFPKDLSQVVQQVAEQIAEKLPVHSRSTNEPSPAAHAPKPEALIMFYRGLNTCAAGQPEWGAAYFINAASLDSDFSIPLLWEIKAYEMAGLPQLAELRRHELAPLFGTDNFIAGQSTNASNEIPRPVLAVLDPVISVSDGALASASVAGEIKQALLKDNRVRVFAYEGIGAAVAEQDLRLSSLFTGQNAPSYGRWLSADGLLFCHMKPAESGRVEIELALINPVNASVMARIRRTQPATAITEAIPSLTKELLSEWLEQPKPALAAMTSGEAATLKIETKHSDLRPIYQDLVAALSLVRQEPDQSDSHRALANALAATGRPQLAAYEIEQCLKRLDIHAPHADTTFLGTHRWLFWEPSSVSGAVGLVNPAAITNLIGRLLAVYPQSLAAGCMRYNLAVTAWQGKDWPEAITQARQSRQILQSLVARYDREAQTDANRGEAEFEMMAATFFLEGTGLRESGKREEARLVFHQGLDFMQAFKVRNFCLPLGPSIGDFFGPERVYGYGGDAPGIKTRLEQELAKLGESITRSAAAGPAPAPLAAAKAPGSEWIQKGRLQIEKGNYLAALECYHQAVAAGASAEDCPRLATTLLEVALNRNLEHPQEEIEKLRRELGFPPVQASWVELFSAARKYQAGKQFDLEKAATCYRGALDFLEHPGQMGIYHLEKEPNSDRIALRWGPSLGEVDLLWSEHYAARWNSAAFYLAQCLILLDQKEEAAQWLRQIALKVGGDSAVPLLERDDWTSSGWSSGSLGVRAAALLQTLHHDKEQLPFGQRDGPFKTPPMAIKSHPELTPALPPIDDDVLQALTNTLAGAAGESDRRKRNLRLQPLVEQHGHDLVPAALMLLTRDDGRSSEFSLVWILENTATAADSPWVVDACTRHWPLIPLAEKLEPDATAVALAGVWQGYAGENFVPLGLIHEILQGRVRPLYALVLEQVAEKKTNHPTDVFALDKVVSEEKPDELEAAFGGALARCLRLKIKQQDNYELRRISQVAVRYGVSEGIEGLLIADEGDPEKLRADLDAVIELPGKDDEMVAFLNANRARWEWNSTRRKFEPSPSKNGS